MAYVVEGIRPVSGSDASFSLSGGEHMYDLWEDHGPQTTGGRQADLGGLVGGA